MKNEVNVASKSIKQKIRLKKLFFVAVLKVTGKNSRIRILMYRYWSEVWIRGSRSGSKPTFHGFGTLVIIG